MTRTTFRHLKTDLMLMGRNWKKVLLAAVAERKILYPCLCRVKDKTISSIMEALKAIQEAFDGSFEALFESITTDNGTYVLFFQELLSHTLLTIFTVSMC